MESSSNSPHFGKVREFFWPIQNYELKKFVPMSLLMFCVLFVYTMVRDIKDNLVQFHAVGGQTELISHLKIWFVMPAAVLTVMLFTWLVNKYGTVKTFYIMISIFLVYFAIFVLFLFPNSARIHASAATVKHLQNTWPPFFRDIIPCITNWSYSLFYVFSEIWGTVSIASLFWQFANKITKKSEVRRFFPLFCLLGNIGTFASGKILEGLSHGVSGDAFRRNLSICIWIAIAFGLISMYIYYWINKVILPDPRFYDPNDIVVKKKKAKVGMMEGVKLLFRSKYLLLIGVLVVGYGVAINLFEQIWKKHLTVTLTANEANGVMGFYSQSTAILTIVMSWIAALIFRKLKWRTIVLITPVVVTAMSGIYFALMIYNNNVPSGAMIMGMSLPLFLAWIGAIMNGFDKGSKYSLFDPTKQMAYHPLDEDEKVKGQAAVEVICGRLGKAGGALTIVLLTAVIFPGSTVLTNMYTIMAICGVLSLAWIMSSYMLGREYDKKVAEKERLLAEAKTQQNI